MLGPGLACIYMCAAATIRHTTHKFSGNNLTFLAQMLVLLVTIPIKLLYNIKLLWFESPYRL